ncbi:hypothetical protein AB1N83_012396 [Pleurotus pulmonarius]
MPLQLALFTHRRRFITGCASSCLSILLRSLTAVGSSLSQVDVRRPASPVCSVHSPPSVLLSHRKCVLPPLQTDPFTHCLAFSPLTALRVLPCLSSLFHSLTTVGSSLSQHAVRRAASPACSVHSPPSVPPSHSSECVVLPLQLAPLTHCRRFLPLTASASSCLLNLLRSLIAFHSPLSQQVVRRPTSYASSVHSSPSVLPSHTSASSWPSNLLRSLTTVDSSLSHRNSCVIPPPQPPPFTYYLPLFPLIGKCVLSRLSSLFCSLSSFCCSFLQLIVCCPVSSACSAHSILPSHSKECVVLPLHPAPFTHFLRSFPGTARSVPSYLYNLLCSLTTVGSPLSQEEVFLWCHHLGETMSIRNLSNFLTELKVRKVEYEDQPCEIEKRG